MLTLSPTVTHYCEYSKLTTQETISSIFSSNSEANVSKLLENLEEIFPIVNDSGLCIHGHMPVMEFV